MESGEGRTDFSLRPAHWPWPSAARGLFRKGCVNWFTLPSHSYNVSLMVGNELNSTGVGSPVIMRLTWLASLKLRCVSATPDTGTTK